jgi:CheY-like chemotaxis protein
MIVFLTTDLMFSSRVTGAGERLGVPVTVVGTFDAALEACCEEQVRLVLIDLTTPGLDLETLVPELKATPSAPHMLAYGPHVHAARLKAARHAGCDQVLTRGQFNAQMDALLKAV